VASRHGVGTALTLRLPLRAGSGLPIPRASVPAQAASFDDSDWTPSPR
jgi:hypothetical protein